jgi:hypothetical protein
VSSSNAELSLVLGRLRPSRRERAGRAGTQPAAETPPPAGTPRRLGLHAVRDAQLRELRHYRPLG